MDFSIPEGLPPEVVARLLELKEELEEGDITTKGYRKHREQVLAQAAAAAAQDTKSEISVGMSFRHMRHPSGFESVISYDTPQTPVMPSNFSLSRQGGISDEPLQAPLPPRGIPETARTDPLNVRVNLSTFDNLPSILRHRARTNAEITAFQILDSKGKDAQSITWAKFASRAERVGGMLREHSGLFRGDRVALVYGESDQIEFVIALMGCFLAGLVAVPVPQNNAMATLREITNKTQSHLCLTTDAILKYMQKHQTSFMASLPKELRWWKTADWTSYNPPKRNQAALQVPDLAYIEFVRSASGELRGVVMSHRTILHQMMCLTAILQSTNTASRRVRADKLLCSLDIRRSTGLIMGVLHTIYSGNLCLLLEATAMATPGLYAHVASRHRATVLLSDYPALKGVSYNYQTAPQATRQFSKRQAVNLSQLRWCLIDAATADPEFQVVLADRWLKPLGHPNARAVVAPMLTLMEHGGMVIAMRDALGDQPPDLIDEVVHVSRPALAENRIEIGSGGDEYAEIGTFGCPVPDATVAIVDPDTHILACEHVVGEIWIDSPSLSGGFWDHSSDTETTFRARCFDTEGVLPPEFLRSGMLGFTHNGLLYILGVLSDRLLQIERLEDGETKGTYFYSPHLMETVVRTVPQVYDGCVFQIPSPIDGIGELACMVIETPLARRTPVNSALATTQNRDKELQFLEDMASQAIGMLASVHNFNLFCVLFTWPNAVPRMLRSGRPDIAKPAARRQLCRGTLPAVHIKFDIASSVAPALPHGDDPQGGIWGAAVSNVRGDSLSEGEMQYSGVDIRSQVLDDRASQPLDKFASIIDILQWRLGRQPDELAYLTILGNGATRETSWKQLDTRISAVHNYLLEHLRVREGDSAVLMYTHGEDYVVAVLACFLLGVTVLPVSPINADRLDEDIGALLKIVKQYKVRLLLGNHETYTMMEEKQAHHWLRSRRLSLPKLHNTSKIKISSALGSIKSFKMKPRSLRSDFPALVWLYFNPDNEYVASQLSHASIIAMCKIQKETCQMTSTKPLVGCVRSWSGLGFLHTCCLGPFIGASTILVSPLDYANNPAVFFVTVGRYKVKDTYGTRQMLNHACRLSQARGFKLDELRNLVVTSSGRADTELVSNMRKVFASTGLESVAVNLAYGTNGNPFITTRSYMLVDNIDLWLDPVMLRQGRVSVVNPANCPQALHLQDSGMVPINTQVAIVNPETCRLCRSGEFGEIWVASDGNQVGYYNAVEPRLRGVIVDGDRNVEYMRTGDLGFLHSVTKGAELEMQVLFVLGTIQNTFEVAGLQHFAQDVEDTILAAHVAFTECVVAVAGGFVVAIVETPADRRYLCSLAAVAALAVLQSHGFAVNCIAFVAKGKIALSRLQEKQRRRILSSFVDGSLSLTGYYAVQATS